MSFDHEGLRFLGKRERVTPIRAVPAARVGLSKSWLHPCLNTVASFYHSTKPSKLYAVVASPGFPGQGKRWIVPVPCSVEHMEGCHKGSKTRGLMFCFGALRSVGDQTQDICVVLFPLHHPPTHTHKHTPGSASRCAPLRTHFSCANHCL